MLFGKLTDLGAETTFTLQVAERPFSVVTDIVALPSVTPVILPVDETVTMLSLDDFHFTEADAPLGSNV